MQVKIKRSKSLPSETPKYSAITLLKVWTTSIKKIWYENIVLFNIVYFYKINFVSNGQNSTYNVFKLNSSQGNSTMETIRQKVNETSKESFLQSWGRVDPGKASQIKCYL